MSDPMYQAYEAEAEAARTNKCLLTTLIEYFSFEDLSIWDELKPSDILPRLKEWIENEKEFVNDQALKQARSRALKLRWDKATKNLPSTKSAWASFYCDLFKSGLIIYPDLYSCISIESPLQFLKVLTYGNLDHHGKITNNLINSSAIFEVWLRDVPSDQLEARQPDQKNFLLGFNLFGQVHIIYF